MNPEANDMGKKEVVAKPTIWWIIGALIIGIMSSFSIACLVVERLA